MPSVTITSPANNGDQFPDPIAGTYSAAGGGSKKVVITVTITNESTSASSSYPANGVPGPGGLSGTWSLAKPANLPAGTYTISATLDTASDTKTGIQN